MKLLDLFCGVGGAAYGYHLAGFSITGVDIKPQPNYPFEFIQADATTFPLDGFDIIHASPPCQGYAHSIRSDGRWSHGVHQGFNTSRLISTVRNRVIETGIPFVIENVVGAKRHLHNPIILCGAMFGLSIRRHRLFETSFTILQPAHPECLNLTHPVAEEWIKVNPNRRDRRIYNITGKGRQTGSFDVWKALLETPWAKRDLEMAEAIPPAYTQYVGEQFKKKHTFTQLGIWR